MKGLEYKSKLSASKRSSFLLRQQSGVLAIKQVLALVGLIQQPQDIQHGRFAGPRRSHDCSVFTIINLEINIAKCVYPLFADLKFPANT